MNFSNLTSKLFAIAVLLGFINISTPVYADTADAWNGTVLRPYLGKGTAEDPFLIASAEEFAFLLQNYDYNNGVCYQKYYKLTCDIDMAACRWTYGINSTENKCFRAHFDGDGHKISNINIVINDAQNEQNIGIFPQIGGDDEFFSGIENLEISNINVEFNQKEFIGKRQFNIGGLVGQMYKNSYIKNCIVNGLAVTDKGSSISLPENGIIRIGGLVANKKNTFAEEKSNVLDNIEIIDSYGLGSADLSNSRGSKNNFNLELEQGTKTEKNVNGFKWYKKQNNTYSFYPAFADITEEPSDANGRHFKARILEGKASKYRWSVDGKELPSTSTECTVPFDVKDRTIAFEMLDSKGIVIASDADLVQPADLKVVIDATKNGNFYTLKSKIVGEGANALASEFTYSWKDMTNGEEEVGSSATLTGAREGHTYLLVATHRKWKFCSISNYYSFTSPIFVNLNGINADDAKKYTINGTNTYPQGNDNNDGLSPEKAVRTLKKAYSLIKSTKIGENIIVIMGDYDANEFSLFTDNSFTEKNSGYFEKNKKAIITGQYGNIANGKILMSARSCVIDEDTRFDNIKIHGKESADDMTLLAQEHNLTMGYGVEMENYAMLEEGRGQIYGTFAPNVTLYGGFLNNENTTAAHKENTIRLLSGYYGRVIAGGQNTKVNEATGNVLGSPRNPIRTSIVIDISNHKNPSSHTFDVALAISGQGNGSCYAVTNIDVKGSSRVGRAIGGNLGFGRKVWMKKKDGSKSDRPTDSFYGQSTINILGGNINEIYGANLGRNGKVISPTENVIDSVSTYFYGKSIINISGGQVRNTIYGAGGGGVTGLAYNDKYHTFDPYIPYTLSNGEIAYGPYAKVKRKMPKVFVKTDSLIDLNKTSVEINISGNARLRGTVYGGGHGYSNQVHTSMASSQSGNLFGESHVNISGGNIDGYVYGGGRGSTSYYDNNDLTSYPVINGVQMENTYFNRLALVYGRSHVNISGGKIIGMVYSGGEGSYYRAASASNPENMTTQMASVVGSTRVDISGNAEINDFVFGGGNYGNVLHTDSDPESGSTFVNISGGKIMNSIFGGGHGHVDREHPERSIVADIEGDTHILITGGEFAWTDEPSRYDTIRYYGIYGSGLTASVVHGSSNVEARKSLLTSDFIAKAGVPSWETGKPWDKRFTICGGGFGEMTDVIGDANVLVNVEEGNAEESKFLDVFGGGLMGNIEGSTHITIKGNPYIRNIYGGCLNGNVGLYDMPLNGDIYTHKTEIRNYMTNATIDFLSGTAANIFGGGLMGNICGETFINIGSEDSIANKNIFINTIFGGNDVSGTIAGSNNTLYGTNINIYGGTINGDIYGSGNGQYDQYYLPASDYNPNSLRYAAVGREHPHVASVSINISGLDEEHRANILGTVYLGGNSTTVGLFKKDYNDRPQYGMLRETLESNTGRARINIGNHVSISNLVMGSNGEHMMDFIPSYTTDGNNWYVGFESQDDFEHFCRTVDMPCVPVLTFNSNRSFKNENVINDVYGNQKVFNTGDEMDVTDVIIGNFIGGGNTGSMVCDDIYNYTLPIGLTITGNVIGGCQNAHFVYTEKEGNETGAVREYIGGFLPYDPNISQYHRLQLNIFCKFAPIQHTVNNEGEQYFTGSNIFGGCYDFGIIHGAASINMHSDMVGEEYSTPAALAELSTKNLECCQIFGAGKGQKTEVIGNTYVSLSGAIFNGQKTIPNLMNVYGGSMEGYVVGRSNVVCDFEVEGATARDAVTHGVWGSTYGGGRMGDVVAESRLIPGIKTPTLSGTSVKVYTGQLNEVFGGSRMADIEGGALVEINDKSHDHFHTIIGRVYGGNDVSGTIGVGTYKNSFGEEVTTNTFVKVDETADENGLYSGFPLIGELFAGGNGNYGVHGDGDSYVSGEVFSENKFISLAGKKYPNVDQTYLDVTGGTIFNAFGGANNSLVRKETTIAVNYKNTDITARFDRTASVECFERGKEMMKHIVVKDGFTEDELLIAAKHNILRLFGGNNKMDMTIQPTWRLHKGKVGTVYGGCNQANAIYYNESEDRRLNPGTSGNVGLALNLDSDQFEAENIFGGCRMGNVQACKVENGRLVPIVFANNQYGTTVNIKAGKYGKVFGGNDVSGHIHNGTRIQIEGGTIDDVFGAGNGEYIYQYSADVKEITECYNEEQKEYYFKVPATAEFGGANANDFQKIQAIATYRPNIVKSFIEIAGGMNNGKREMATVTHAIYGGGNCATINGNENRSGEIKLHIGDYCTIENLYLGSNGEPHINPQYISKLLSYNNMGSLAQVDSNGRTLLDHHMDAVIMHGLPEDFQFHRNYDKCYIGSFFMGGNRGSLSTHGELSLSFPRTLKIRDKIVGGSNRADIVIKGNGDEEDLIHLGGILWDGIGKQPKIDLEVNCLFVDENGEETAAQVYPGCYQSGKIEGEVNVSIND